MMFTTVESPPEVSPFHPGEREVQLLAGVREEAEPRGQRMLTPVIGEQQAQFFRGLPFVVTATVDDAGQPWAGLITGAPGFIGLDVARRQARIDWARASSPTGAAARPGSDVGLLGIDAASRRRNRLNGTVFSSRDEQWRLLVTQSYGNCPKYITPRAWPAQRFGGTYTCEEQAGLSPAAAARAVRTDTFFIASASGPAEDDAGTGETAWGLDASHRGGEPGFLRVENGGLAFDDFPGNNLFNTLGNLRRYPPCGLLMLDYDSGEILQLAARGEVRAGAGGLTVQLDIVHTRHWLPLETP